LLLLLCAALAGCHTASTDTGGLGVRDGGYGELPNRTVVTDLPDVPFPSDGPPPLIGGGISGGSNDARTADPGPGQAPDAADDGAAAAGSCSVLTQDCGALKGCYPAGGGKGACAPAGELGAQTPCGEHTQCAPGLICVDAFGVGAKLCEPVCDVNRSGACPKGDLCRPYAGNVGFCAP
jgi:hypothetical protein